MLDLIELLSSIGELLFSWRLYVAIAATAGLIYIVWIFVPGETARWILCTPIGIAGVVFAFWWQTSADQP